VGVQSHCCKGREVAQVAVLTKENSSAIAISYGGSYASRVCT
jgi:hypothetical protein